MLEIETSTLRENLWLKGITGLKRVMTDREDIANITMIWFSTAIGWKTLQNMDLAMKFDYWSYAPNRYRLFHQLLMLFHDNPFSIVTLISLSFGICMTVVYLTMKTDKRNIGILLLGTILTGALGYGYNAIVYPLMVVIGRLRNDKRVGLLLIPLALIKEFVFFIASVFLFIQNDDRERKGLTLTFSALGVALYLVVRFMILGDIGNYPGSAPLLTPLYMLENIDLWFFGMGVAIVLTTLLTVRYTKDLIVVAINAVVVSALALWWEPQLWLPIIVLLLASNYNRLDNSTKHTSIRKGPPDGR
jgi:hypothetical protein